MVAHIKNRVKSSVHERTPYELWMGRKPNIKYMRRFGCVAYVLIKGGKRRKSDAETNKGIFIGYGYNNTYRVYIPEEDKVQCACDVSFDEKRNGVELLKRKGKEQRARSSNLVFIGMNNRNEESINESGNSDSDEEGIHFYKVTVHIWVTLMKRDRI